MKVKSNIKAGLRVTVTASTSTSVNVNVESRVDVAIET